MNPLRDSILAQAVVALDETNRPGAAASVEALRDVFKDEPELETLLSRKIAAKLRDLCGDCVDVR